MHRKIYGRRFPFRPLARPISIRLHLPSTAEVARMMRGACDVLEEAKRRGRA